MTTTSTLTVHCQSHDYPIYMGANTLDSSLWQQHIPGKQILIITNDTIAPHYLSQLQQQLSGFKTESLILKDGERYKNIDSFNAIINTLIDHQYHKDATLIALGGGVICDITGFAASCYQRGINVIHLPTSFLAQVDASIGGKTAINHPKAKNMIGSFYQPNAVVIDTNTLNTLAEREYRSAIAEIIKIALVQDADFFYWLEQHANDLLNKKPEAILHAINRSCELKAKLVEQDETDQAARALLNFGHSFGHALEQILGYSHWLHGEAVAWGMLRAAELSTLMGLLSPSNQQRIDDLISTFNIVPNTTVSFSFTDFKNTLLHDKKIKDHTLSFIVIHQIGTGVLCNTVDDTQLQTVLQPFLSTIV